MVSATRGKVKRNHIDCVCDVAEFFQTSKKVAGVKKIQVNVPDMMLHSNTINGLQTT